MIVRVLIAVAVLGLAACGGDSGSSADPAGTWTLTSGSGDVSVLADHPTTLIVAENGAGSGQATCNVYGGLTLADGTVEGEIAGTMMACEGEQGTAEQAYFAALGDADAYEVDGDTLTLTGPDVELTFERL